MGYLTGFIRTYFRKPWREIHSKDFKKTESYLKDQLRVHNNTRINILLVGHVGAGKSSLLNSILSISRGYLANTAKVRSDVVPGHGTNQVQEVNAGTGNLFQNVYIYDTIGFTPNGERDAVGASDASLRALFEGQLPDGHMYNVQLVTKEAIRGNKPDCVIFVVSADVMDNIEDSPPQRQLKSLYTMIPDDVSRIAVITKTDVLCKDTNDDIRNIYYSEKVHELVQNVGRTLHIQENMIYPVVNFVKQVELKPESNVPILYALRSAINFAHDRK